MPLSNGANEDAALRRQTLVAKYRLSGMTLREIVIRLEEDEEYNPHTGKPWSHGIIGTDLKGLRAAWTTERMNDVDALMQKELEELDALLDNLDSAIAQRLKQQVGKQEQYDDDGHFIGADPIFQEIENIPAINSRLKVLESRRRLLALDRLPKAEKQSTLSLADLLLLVQEQPEMVKALLAANG